MKTFIAKFDSKAIGLFRRFHMPMARLALFVAFFWFGALKLFGVSPANPLVESLLERTLPFVTFDTFIIFFGIFEMLIGILFITPRLERVAIAFLVPHMVTTSLPLFLVPEVVWGGFFVPTLEGQYIIKNLAIIAIAMTIAAKLDPFNSSARQR